MSIRPVDLSGMIQRTQDIGNIKHAEDSRPVADQYNIEVRQEKQESDLSHKVQDPEQKDNQEFRYDAREKGITAIAVMEKRKKSMASRMRMKEVFILRNAGPALMSKYNERHNG